MSAERYDIFISHNSKDKPLIDPLVERLAEDYEIRSWLDKWDLRAAEAWAPAIQEALNSSNACAVVLGENGWGPYHLKEARRALELKEQNPNYKVIPLLLPGAKLQDSAVLGDFFQRTHRVDFSNGIEDEEAFRRLVSAIRGEAPGLPPMTVFTIKSDARKWNQMAIKDRPSILYRGSRLRLAQRIAAEHTEKLNSDSVKFLTESAEEERRSIHAARNRTRKIITGLVVGLILIAGAAIFAFIQRGNAIGQAEIAEQRRTEAETERKRAVEQQGIAEGQTKLAEDRRIEAEKQTGIAREKTELAQQQTKIANEQRQEAVKQRQHAVEQQKIAEERRQEAERQTKLAFSRELAASANFQSPLDPALGLQLSLAAMKTTANPTREAVDAFRTSMTSLSNLYAVFPTKFALGDIQVLTVLNPAPVLKDVNFSPDGELLVASDGGGFAYLWDIKSRRKIAEISGHKRDNELLPIWSVQFSPRGDRVLTTSIDKTVRLWDRSGQPVAVIDIGSAAARQALFSPDGKFVVTVDKMDATYGSIKNDGDDSIPQVWDADTGKHITGLPGHTESVEEIEFSPDGKYIAAMNRPYGSVANDYRGSALIWRTADWKLETRFDDLSAKDRLLRFSQKGNFCLVIKNNTPIIYEVGSWREIRRLEEGHCEKLKFVDKGREFSVDLPIEHTLISPTGKTIITQCEAGPYLVWETAAGKKPFSLPDLYEMNFSPDGKFITGGNENGFVSIFEASTGRLVTTIEDFVRFSPDSATFLTGEGHSVKLWRTDTWQNISSLPGHKITEMVYDPSSKYIATGSVDGRVLVWDTESKVNVTIFHSKSAAIFTGEFSPNGKLFYTFGSRGRDVNAVEIWDAASGQELQTLDVNAPLNAVSFDEKSERIYVLDKLKTLHIWDARTGKTGPEKEIPLDIPLYKEFTSHFSDDLKYLAIWKQDALSVQIVELETGKIIANLPQDKGSTYDSRLLFIPGKKQLLISSNGSIKLWDYLAEKVIYSFPYNVSGHSPLIAYNRDRQLIAIVAGEKLTIKDAQTWANLNEISLSNNGRRQKNPSPEESFRRSIIGFTDYGPMDLAFSPDGAFVIIAGDGADSYIWDWQKGREAAVLSGYSEMVIKAMFSPDRKYVFTIDSDGIGRLYPWEMYAPLDQLLKLAPSRTTRNLTFAEKDKFLHIPSDDILRTMTRPVKNNKPNKRVAKNIQ
jgi:WD40 repeat protein